MRRRILLITDDDGEAAKIKHFAAQPNSAWEIEACDSWKKAMTIMADSSFDVVLSEFQMKRITGLEFLNYVWKTYPKVVRFVMANEADRDLITGCVLGSHLFLPKPLDTNQLREALERTFLVDELIGNRQVKDLVSRIRTFPCIPTLYVEVMKELLSSTSSPQSIGSRIAKDLAMTTKLIQMVNSAYFGFSRQIADPGEAVQLLGTETVRSLVLGIHAFAQADKVKPIYFSIDRVWRHSVAVGEAARRITQRVTGDKDMGDSAYTAGLLHDVGKLILATNFDAQYGNALMLAKKQKICPAAIERDIFGLTHADTGAYLLSLWGMPMSIIEATAVHHSPSRARTKSFSIATAIHVANFLEHESNPGQDGFADPQIDHDYLAGLGLQDRLDEWRAVVRGDIMPARNRTTPAAERPTPRNAAPKREEESVVATPVPRRVPWNALAGAAACVILVSGAIVWKSCSSSSKPTVAQALTKPPRSDAKPAVVSTVASVARQPQSDPAPGRAVEAPKSQPVSAPASVEAVAPAQPVATTEPQVVKAAPKTGFDAIKLQSVIYSASSANSSVMINGQVIRRGENYKGVEVLDIGPGEATLQFGGEKRVFRLDSKQKR